VLQIARNVTDAEQGYLCGKKYLLRDRDATFSEVFRVVLKQAGAKAVRLPPCSPNMTPHIERFNANLAVMRSCHGGARAGRD
jgi:putative transposase